MGRFLRLNTQPRISCAFIRVVSMHLRLDTQPCISCAFGLSQCPLSLHSTTSCLNTLPSCIFQKYRITILIAHVSLTFDFDITYWRDMPNFEPITAHQRSPYIHVGHNLNPKFEAIGFFDLPCIYMLSFTIKVILHISLTCESQ